MGTPTGTISGTLTGATYGYLVTLTITNPAGAVVFADRATVASNGTFNDTFHPGVNSLWVSGTYSVKATYGSFHANSTFSYTPASAVTSTVIQHDDAANNHNLGRHIGLHHNGYSDFDRHWQFVLGSPGLGLWCNGGPPDRRARHRVPRSGL